LRRRGIVAKLLLVGKRGLGSDAVYAKIAATPQLAGDVHVFHDMSDAELQYAFTRARALVYPSVAEGFGLPLVEALTHHLPVFASDIPVFREIADGHAVYFDPLDVTSITDVLEAFLVRGEYAPSRSLERFAWISWEQSVTRLFDLLQQAVVQQSVVQQTVGKQVRA
jgi:alpha-1,2-rhamnosyltransferase